MKELLHPLCILLCIALTTCGFRQEKAELILHNGTIHTLDEQNQQFEAMAVRNGKIIALGPEREILNRFASLEKIDIQGRHAYPGFIDAHSHFMGYARNFLRANLLNVASPAEMIERLQAFRRDFPELPWLTGRGWDHTLWENAQWPSRAMLDSVFADIPVLLIRVDGHSGVMNSRAFALFREAFPGSVPGGIIEQQNGKYTGIVKEKALDAAQSLVPDASPEQLVRALKRAENKLFRAGLTTVTDAGLPKKDVLFLDSLYRRGELSIPLYIMSNPDSASLQWLATSPDLDSALTFESVKLYADGSLGSRSACLKSEYADDPGNFGLLTVSESEVIELARFCIEHQLQLNTHAIGDSAAKVVLSAYGQVLQTVNDYRWRLEHAQVVDPNDHALFRKYAIIPSVQPTHATSDMRWAEDRLGSPRIHRAYAFKSLMKPLGMLALGTDFPVEDIDPLKTFYAAVFRQQPFTDQPSDGFLPDEALNAEQALRGMTLWAALACRMEQSAGSLEVGKNANAVVLNQNLLETENIDWENLSTEMTLLHGNVVYQR